MPPVTPKSPAPTPLSESFEATAAKLQQGALLRGLREGLLKANVARATVDQVVSDQEQTQTPLDEFRCYVATIGIAPASVATGGTPDTRWVSVRRVTIDGSPATQRGDQVINFPPNDAKYLAEFVRAQNHHFRVYLSLNAIAGQEPMINYMYVTQLAPDTP
jgi:hypothetical protein